MGILHAYLCTTCKPSTTEVRRQCWISWNQSYRELGDAMWILGMKPRSLPTEPSLQAFYLLCHLKDFLPHSSLLPTSLP